MKQCTYCSKQYRMEETACPACAAIEAEFVCAYCNTLHAAEKCPDCGFGIEEEIISCPQCQQNMRGRVCESCGHDVAANDSLLGTTKAIFNKSACALINHNWVGCKCTRCGETQNEGHVFYLVKDKCEERCSVCGWVKNVPHVWENASCERCGLEKNFFESFWERVSGWLPFINFHSKSNRLFFSYAIFLIGMTLIALLVYYFAG